MYEATWYCPCCGGDTAEDLCGVVDEIDGHATLYTRNTLYRMRCGAIVEDGMFLTKAEAANLFGE